MIFLDEGAYLIRQGDVPTCGYLIERGSVDVLFECDGGERQLAVLGEGEIVGEMALIDRAPRSASVRAREACMLLPITAESLEKRLAVADPVLHLVLGTVLDRFRAMLGASDSPPPATGCAPSRTASSRAAANAELRLEREFADALVEGQISVHYQPIVRLSDGCLTGFEALARWLHPERGLIPPTTFVPIAEASGSSGALTRVCLAQVMRDLPALRARGAARRSHVGDPRISVNISGHDLMIPGFVDALVAIVRDGGGSPDDITLELTETMLVRNPGEAAVALQQARDLGFKIAVDDFGTGYATLNYIRTLPIDTLKIDKSFIQGMTECATTRSIVASTLMLAASLEIAVVGEGIEIGEQHGLLQMLGCDYGQGYLFGRPLPLAQVLGLIDGWTGVAAPDQAIFAPCA